MFGRDAMNRARPGSGYIQIAVRLEGYAIRHLQGAHRKDLTWACVPIGLDLYSRDSIKITSHDVKTALFGIER
jgi:hypothetical protein